MIDYKIFDTTNIEKNIEYNQVVKSAYFLKRISEYTNAQDKLNTYYSYVLLKELAQKNFDLNVDELQILKDKDGCPIVSGNKFYFNISHSKNLVSVVVSDKNVGIDLQKVAKYNKKIAKKYFSPKEKLVLKFVLRKNYYFTKYWAKLEANIKYYKNYKKMLFHVITKGEKLNYKFLKLKDKNKIKYICCVAY